MIVPKVQAKTPLQKKTRSTSPFPSTSKEIETTKQGFNPGDDDDDITEKEAQTEEQENVGTVASPSRSRRRSRDTQYGIRKDGETLMIAASPGFIDRDDNITIKGTVFRGTEGLWEILTRKNVNMQLIGKEKLKT